MTNEREVKKMEWTCEEIEDTFNYMRVVLGAEKIFMFYLDNDRIGYWTSDGICHQKVLKEFMKKCLTNNRRYDIIIIEREVKRND